MRKRISFESFSSEDSPLINIIHKVKAFKYTIYTVIN